jgi:hypothetical protein
MSNAFPVWRIIGCIFAYISLMKTLKIFLPLMLLTLVVCAQTIKDVRQIEFSTSTRGSYKQIIFTPKEMIISEENRASSKGEERQNKKLKSAEWKNLCNTLKQVSISGIPELNSPTMKRSFDGARTSTITISTKDGKTWSHSFDNEEPNEQLQKLMNAITSLEAIEKNE